MAEWTHRICVFFRRLGYALVGKQFLPLDIGTRVWFAGPSGSQVAVEITSIAVERDLYGPDRLTIEGRSPLARLTNQHLNQQYVPLREDVHEVRRD